MTIADTTNDAETEAQLPSAQQRWIDVLLIVLVFFIAMGDRPPHVNESHYLCRLKHFWDPEWCKGDLFLESTDTQVLFIWLFGWITRFVSLSATAWIGRVVTWTLLAWAWQRLSWRVVPKPLTAVLSAALFVGLNRYLNLAGEWVVGGVEAKCFAYVFVLLALRELMDGRWNLVWLTLGAATAFHPIVGGWGGLLCVGIWLFDARRELMRLPTLPGFAAGGLLALIGILPALMLTWNVHADVVKESNQIYVFERLPHHLALLALPQDEATRRFAGHAVLLFLFWILSRASRAVGLTGGKPIRPLTYVTHFAWGAVLLAVIGLAIELVFYNRPDVAAKLLRYYWFRMTDFAAAMAVSLQLTALVAIGIQQRRAWAAPLLFVALALAGGYLSITAWSRVQNPIAPADAKATNYANWVEVCDWIAENTPEDSLFITPRLNSSFKWRTGRPEVVNRKDIPQDAPGIVEWHRRLKDIFTITFGGRDQSIDSVGALGTERVRELAKTYHAQYALSDRAQLLALPIAFWNDEYVVYHITD